MIAMSDEAKSSAEQVSTKLMHPIAQGEIPYQEKWMIILLSIEYDFEKSTEKPQDSSD